MAYATLADLRDFGVSVTEADDAQAQGALDLGAAIIDTHFGPFSLAEEQTKTFVVTGPAVVLPRPFRDVVAVTSGGIGLSSTGYSVTDIGIVIGYFDDWVRNTPSDTYSGHRRVIAVTATFGYDTFPPQLARANLLLAKDAVANQSAEHIPSNVKQLAREGYSITFDRASSAKSISGNVEIDALLGGLVSGMTMVV